MSTGDAADVVSMQQTMNLVRRLTITFGGYFVALIIYLWRETDSIQPYISCTHQLTVRNN